MTRAHRGFRRTTITAAGSACALGDARRAGSRRYPLRFRPPASEESSRPRQTFEATAYSVDGVTASGRTTRRGIVAADPGVLPLGTHIRVLEAGPYSGMYLVADTGRAIKGHKIDIFIPDDAEARRFGKRPVQVERVDSTSGPIADTAP
jgi:3D (Asp-Asp-Asp) domain-containing protein